MLQYKERHAKKFIKDMESAGLEVHHYEGRYFYKGPSVHVDNLQEALSYTKVPCKWDSLGLGYVVHTAQSATLISSDED